MVDGWPVHLLAVNRIWKLLQTFAIPLHSWLRYCLPAWARLSSLQCTLLCQSFLLQRLDRKNEFSLSTDAFDAAMHILLSVAQVVSSISHCFDSSTPAPRLVVSPGTVEQNPIGWIARMPLLMCLNTIIHLNLLLLATTTSSCKIVAVPEQPIHAYVSSLFSFRRKTRLPIKYKWHHKLSSSRFGNQHSHLPPEEFTACHRPAAPHHHAIFF